MSKAIERTSRGIAAAMFEELELLRDGKSTPQQARAKASIANTICAVSRLEMDFARFVSSTRSDDENTNGLKSLPMA
jgi:hypothetical protein